MGNLRTAILAWAAARLSGRRFVMRIEDIDRERAGSAQRQLDDLEAIGVDWDGEPGVFVDLRKVKAGATIAVTRADGTIADFEVTEVTAFPKSEFPTDLVYGTLDYAGLRLITCGGAFDEGADSYDDNIVAFAKLVGSRAQ